MWCLYTTSMFSDITKTIIDMGDRYTTGICSDIIKDNYRTLVSIYSQNVLWYHKDNNRHGYLYTTSIFADITKTIIDIGSFIKPGICSDIHKDNIWHGCLYTSPGILWNHKDNNRHGYLYTASVFFDIVKTIIDMGIYIQPVCSLISQSQ